MSISHSLEKQNADNGYPVCRVRMYILLYKFYISHYDINKAQKHATTVILHSTVTRLLHTKYAISIFFDRSVSMRFLDSDKIYTTTTSKTNTIYCLIQFNLIQQIFISDCKDCKDYNIQR